MVEAVLLDADGVLQRVVGGWRTTLERLFGAGVEDVRPALEAAEAPALRGEADFGPALAGLLADHGVTTDPERVYAELWLSVEVDPGVLAVAEQLRRGGTEVHLASNQHSRRAAFMDHDLGYAGLFPRRFYSCDLGLAKPAPAYFEAVVARLGADPRALLFVDDNAANVTAAREVGLHAEQWDLDTGHPALHALLARHGLSVSARGTA